MANPRTVIDWKAFSDKSLTPADIAVLIAISFGQARAECAILSRKEIAESARIREDNVRRHIRKLAKAGHISIEKIPGVRHKKYTVGAVTTRNQQSRWIKQQRQDEQEDHRELQQKLAARRRAEIAVVRPPKRASSKPI